MDKSWKCVSILSDGWSGSENNYRDRTIKELSLIYNSVSQCFERRLLFYFRLLSIHSMMLGALGRGASRLMIFPFLSNIIKRGMPVTPYSLQSMQSNSPLTIYCGHAKFSFLTIVFQALTFLSSEMLTSWMRLSPLKCS